MRHPRLRLFLSVIVAIAFAAISLLHVPMMLGAAQAAPTPCHDMAEAIADPAHSGSQHERALPDRMMAGCPLASLPPPPTAIEPADPRRPVAHDYALAASLPMYSADAERPDPPPRAAA